MFALNRGINDLYESRSFKFNFMSTFDLPLDLAAGKMQWSNHYPVVFLTNITV